MNTDIQNVKERLNEIQKRLDGIYDVGVIVRAFLKYCPEPIVMVDKNQKILLWTKNFSTEFGLDGYGDLSDIHIKNILPEFCEGHNKLCDLIASLKSGTGTVKTDSGLVYEYSVDPWPINGTMGGCVVSLDNKTLEYSLYNKLKNLPSYVTCENQSDCVLKAQGVDIVNLAKSIIGKVKNND